MKSFKLIILAVLLVIANKLNAQIIPSYVPTNGLIGWWPFTGNANDASLNANNGVVNGAVLTTDRFNLSNSSYTYNGINNRISIPNSSTLNPSYMSVSVWVKPSSFTNSWQYIVDKSQDLNSTYVNRSWSIRITSAGILELELRANNVFYVYTSTTTLSLSNWSHLVYTFDGLVAKLYYNTNLILSQNVIGILPTTNNSDLSIGYFPHTSMPPYGYFWNGKIDDIGYWNRALAQEEISALYNGAPAGITSVNKEKNINAFPNPSKNKFNLTVDDQFMNTNYKVIDQIGKSLCDGVINTSITEIDLSSFASGIYFIQVGNLNKETIKIVKE